MNHPAADCARCGDCCERIPFIPLAELHYRVALHPGSAAYAEPPDYLQDAAFVVRHWREIEGSDSTPGGKVLYTCDAFDSKARLCTARSGRPPVCRNYPWYGGRHATAEHAEMLPVRCSFRADFPEVAQPVTLLPTRRP